MNWIENVLIIVGISLDIFATTECQGSLVAKIDKKQLALVCALVSVWQIVALALGNFLSDLLYSNKLAHDEKFVGLVIAAVIFFGLGVRQVVKAVRNEWINEHREEKLNVRHLLQTVVMTSVYTLLAGIAFGFLGTDLALMLLLVAGITIAVVIMGMYTGYHMGFEHKTKAYVGGALLLWIAGIDVIVRHIMCQIG